MKAQKKKRRGFTLVELMVVLAILGILAAIAIPKYNEVKYTASVDADVRTAEAIIHAARMEILLDEKLAGVAVADLEAVAVTNQLPYLETENPKVQSGASDAKFTISYDLTTDVLTIKFVTTKDVKLGTGGATGKNVTVTEGGEAVSAA